MGITLLRALQFACLLSSVALAHACAGATPKAQETLLHIAVEPRDARVYVDEEFLGTAWVLKGHAVPLNKGPHFIVISSTHYFPHHLKLYLRPGTTQVRVALRPIPP
jgi:hypothetical protein